MSLDEGGRSSAEHGLLAEEVGLGLLRERGLDDAGPGAPDALGVGEGGGLGVSGGVPVNGEKPGRALPFPEHLPYPVAR